MTTTTLQPTKRTLVVAEMLSEPVPLGDPIAGWLATLRARRNDGEMGNETVLVGIRVVPLRKGMRCSVRRISPSSPA